MKKKKEDIKKVSFKKEVDKTFSIINNDIDTTDFLLTNGVNEKDIIELMKHKGMMPEESCKMVRLLRLRFQIQWVS